MKPLLVGENVARGSGFKYALCAYPRGSAGWRLCYLVLQLSRDDYYTRFERTNLCRSRWDAAEAKARATALRAASADRVLVLLGSRVSAAFGAEFAPFTVTRDLYGARLAILPHPSGRSRLWLNEQAPALARKTIEVACET